MGLNNLKGVALPQGTNVRLLRSLRRRAYEHTIFGAAAGFKHAFK